jgi:hypothetical protein
MPFSMLVTELGMVMEVIPQMAKAEFPILVTEVGMVIEVRLLQ